MRSGGGRDLAVVVMTRNRRSRLLKTLDRLTRLPEEPSLIVADNGSTDGTVEAVRDLYPDVDVLPLAGNTGVLARNLAVERTDAAFVAFSDDDSWWNPGSLAAARSVLRAHPRLGLICARIVVGEDGHEDPICTEMGMSPVELHADLPGIPILGFLACAAVVRREAFEAVGGFETRLHFGGEEELIATDLVAAGWGVRYLPNLLVRHYPAAGRDDEWRRRRGVRNALWYLWLRRPAASAVRRSVALLRDAQPDGVTVRAAVEALWGLPWVLRERRVVPSYLERELRRLEESRPNDSARQYRA